MYICLKALYYKQVSYKLYNPQLCALMYVHITYCEEKRDREFVLVAQCGTPLFYMAFFLFALALLYVHSHWTHQYIYSLLRICCAATVVGLAVKRSCFLLCQAYCRPLHNAVFLLKQDRKDFSAQASRHKRLTLGIKHKIKQCDNSINLTVLTILTILTIFDSFDNFDNF